MAKKKVLVVEDMKERQEQWQDELDGKVEVLSALSIKQAEELFATNSDIAAIVMDACVPGDEPNTQPLVAKFRTTFKGPMIATSSLSEYRQKLLRAGCDHESMKDKVPEKILQVLCE